MDSPLFAPSVEAARLKLIAAIRAPNTVVAYGQAWKNFRAWCNEHSLPALPSTPEFVGAFAAELAITRKRRPSTVAVHVAAIAYFHRQAGLEPPVDVSVQYLVRGAKRIGADARGKAALTIAELGRMVAQIPATTRGLRNRAILIFGFATAMRRSSLCALELDDVEFRHQGLAVRVRREKNNPAGAPRWIGVFAGRDPALCPVASLRAWLAARGPVAGTLFCPVAERLRPDLRLDGKTIGRIVQRAAARIGLDPRRYGAHSLRAGFVTAAAEAGTSPLVIMQTTGHRSMSTLQRYFRPALVFNVNPLAGIL